MIDPKWIINLKGRDYPTWPGILDAATKAGLRCLETTLVQAPTEANGNLAIVSAIATFEDGRCFTDLGDASPKSTSAQLASAIVRLASTRAKGRVLRDSLNVGQTMWEELPEGDQVSDGLASSRTTPQVRHERAVAPPTSQSRPPAPVGPNGGEAVHVASAPAGQQAAADADPLVMCDWVEDGKLCGRSVEPMLARAGMKAIGRTPCRLHAAEAKTAYAMARQAKQEQGVILEGEVVSAQAQGY